ncbi:hypothetical protein [Deinococcus aerophilus]|uniref:Uncharacterized protein n=1 Tax=Deinococcus aerophilus TaxID=522488 RepID=A0ABQ2GM66_9DEIO|nr:hypothetical protein [Deinococcus aerophilus]GGM03315.1 hypothetical protein GCM10010841_09700 [Deinococcus aerophilus]
MDDRKDTSPLVGIHDDDPTVSDDAQPEKRSFASVLLGSLTEDGDPPHDPDAQDTTENSEG